MRNSAPFDNRNTIRRINTLLLGLLIFISCIQASFAERSKVLKLEGKTYATLEQTRSADGQVVLAIAITPRQPGVNPVDWTEYAGGDGLGTLMNDKEWVEPKNVAQRPKADYFAETRLVFSEGSKSFSLDFPAHRVLISPNGFVTGDWSRANAGEKTGLLIANGRLGTVSVVGVRFSPSEVRETELDELLRNTMEREFKAVHGKKFQLLEHSSFQLRSLVSPDAFTLLCTNFVKSRDSVYTLLVRVWIESGNWRVERLGKSGPAVSDAEYQGADAQLNRVYKALIQRLGANDIESLKQSQRGWIQERDQAVKEALKIAKLRPETPEGKALRNQVMRDFTENRTAVLEEYSP